MSELRREWPLVVFTVLVQLAFGISVVSALLDGFGAPLEIVNGRPLGVAVFPTVAVGLSLSLLHLGRPLDAWKSLLNLRRSRLSAEVLLTFVFAVLAYWDSWLWFSGVTQLRTAAGTATAAAGLAAVISSASVYMVAAQPFWNLPWVPASFLGTSLLLGGAAASIFLRPSAANSTNTAVLALTIAGSLVLALSIFAMRRGMQRLTRATIRSLGSNSYGLMLGIVAAACLPAVLGLISTPTRLVAAVAFSAALVAAFLGRMLMYALAASLPRF